MTKAKPTTYFTDQPDQVDQPKTMPSNTISWQSSDVAKHTYTKSWYLKMTIFFAAITLGAYFLLDSIITVVLFITVYIALIIYTKKSPQTISYSLSSDGLFVNDQRYPLDNFSSFGILPDKTAYSIVLLPAKRLDTSMNLSFDEKDGEAIVDFLGAIMPMREIQESFIDKIIRQIGL